MRKITAILLAVVLTIGMLAACGNTGSNQTAAPAQTQAAAPAETQAAAPAQTQAAASAETQAAAPAQTEAAAPAETQAPAPAEEEDTATIVMAYYVGMPPQDGDRIAAALNEITLEKCNVEVDLRIYDMGSFNQQVSLAISSGEQLDLCPTFFFGPTTFQNMASQNQLLPMNDLLDQYGQDILASLKPEYLATTTVNGNVLAVPCSRDIVSHTYFGMRTDILEQLNLVEKAQNMTSFEEMEEILQAVKDNTDLTPLAPSSAGVFIVNNSVLSGGKFEDLRYFDQLLNDYIVAFVDEPDKVVNLYDTDVYESTAKLLEDWYNKGLIDKDAGTAQDSGSTYIAAGKDFAYFFTGETPSIAEAIANCGMDMTVVDIGTAPVSTNAANLIDWGIPVTAKEPEAAMKVLNLMYTDAEVVNLLCYGQEGIDYVVNADGTYSFPEGVNMGTVGYHTDLTWLFGNQFLCGVWEGGDPDVRAKSQAVNDAAVLSPLMGFIADSSDLENAISGVTAIYNEYVIALNSGVMDVDTELPKFREKLAGAGMPDLVNAIQEQLDAWLAQQ